MRRLKFALAMLVALAGLVMAIAVGCDEPADTQRFEECANSSSEAMCKTCCETRGAVDYDFEPTGGEPPCECVPVP